MDINDVISKVNNLVSMPMVYLRVRELIDEKAPFDELADAISCDPAISARVLRIVNSSYFGFSGQIETTSHAVSMMGTTYVHDLLLASSITSAFSNIHPEHFDMERYWLRSVKCAINAKLLATHCNVLDSERLFVLGLLSNIGHLVMYQVIPDETERAYETATNASVALHIAENDILGFDCASVGAELLKSWGLPLIFSETIANQNTPSSSTEYPFETSIIHAAVQISCTTKSVKDASGILMKIDPVVIEKTRITEEVIPKLLDESRTQLETMLNLFAPDMAW